MQKAKANIGTPRIVICLLASILLATVSLAEAQKVPRIGLLSASSRSPAAPSGPNHEAFRQGLRELGYVEGRNIAVEYRYAEGKPKRLAELAAELVRLKVDIIVTGATQGTLAAKSATTTIPIVMATSGDAVRREGQRFLEPF